MNIRLYFKLFIHIRRAFFLLSALLLLGCGEKKNPCLEEWNCRDCNCMFDKIQQNLHDAQKLQKIQECYDKACK